LHCANHETSPENISLIMLTLLITNNLALLGQARQVLLNLTAQEYALAPTGFHSSLGQHMRHILDHYRAILNAGATGIVNYELRERNTPVESDIGEALKAIHDICSRLHSIADGPILLQLETSAGFADGQTMASSVERELIFAFSHCVHHFAIMGIFLRAIGKPAPADFGVAPATLAYHESLAR
jgi:uncharacterized damage-inducible protein DinB